MKPIKILIADDHAMVREGLRQLLDLQNDIEVVGEARDGIEALEKARELKPDVLLMDIAMPRLGGLDALKLIRESVPEARVVILSMYEKDAFAQEALRNGAVGFVLKGAPSSDMLAAIRNAHANRFFLSQSIQATVIDGYLAGGREKAPTVYDQLSEREKQVFALLIEGNSIVQISDILCVSGKTVETHRANINRKIGTSNPVSMVKFAIRHGIIDLESWNG